MRMTKKRENVSLFWLGIKKLKRNRLAMAGLIVLVLLILTALSADLIAPYGRDSQDLLNTYSAPSAAHLLGTDEFGRDVFTRLLYAARVSLCVGLVSTSISLAIGVLLGAAAGFFGGLADAVIMRLVDIFMCFPFYVIAITVASIFGASIWNLMLLTGLLRWTNIARIVRAEVLTLRKREFIEAARALGLSRAEIIGRHILPNVFAPIIVYATLGIANGILSEAGLSYLGLGVTPPQPSWGNMLASAQSLRVLRSYWWLWMPPGIAVFVTILSINFLGDGLRDAFDPHLN